MAATLPNRSSFLFALACLAAAAISTVWVVLAYELGIALALVLPFALALVAAVAWSPTAGVCIAFLCAPIDYLAAGGGGGPSVTPSEAVFFLTALSAAPRLADSLSARRVPKPFWAFGVLVVVSVAGVFVATETYVVARIVIDWIAFGVVGLYVSQLPLRSAKAVAFSLALAGGILGLTAIGSLGGQESQAGGAIISGRAEGSFAHPTSLALFLILSFPLAFAFGLRGWKNLRLPMMLCGIAGLIGLIATQTRGSFIGAGIALIWMMWRWQPFRRFAAVAVLVLALGAVFNLGSVFGGKSASVVTERLSSLSLSGQGDQRLEIWETTPKIIAEHPLLGIGQGNFPYVSPDFGLHDVGGLAFDHAHDVFLNIAVELGLPALVVFLYLIGSVIGTARRALRNRAGPVYPFAIAVSTSLLALIINSLTEYPMRQNLILATILVVVALLCAFERAARKDEDGSSGELGTG